MEAVAAAERAQVIAAKTMELRGSIQVRLRLSRVKESRLRFFFFGGGY